MRVMPPQRVNEGVIIGGKVQVTVLEIRSDSVRLGISSPRAESPDIFDYWEETLKVELPETADEPLESVR